MVLLRGATAEDVREGLVLGRPHRILFAQVQVQGYNPSARVTHAQCGMQKRNGLTSGRQL